MVIANLTSKTTMMHARLTEHVTPFNDALQMPDVASMLNLATDPGRALLDQIVTQQATMIAYLNDFKLLMVLTLALIPLVLIIGTPKRRPAAARSPTSRRRTRSDPASVTARRGRNAGYAPNSFLIFSRMLAERRHRAVAARLARPTAAAGAG